MNINIKKPLNAIMEFDYPIEIHEDGSITDGPANVRPPECYINGDGDIEAHVSPGWQLLTGYSGGFGYRGPIMDDAEYIGGQMETDIRETPGIYVAVVVDDLSDDNPAGWAVAHKL